MFVKIGEVAKHLNVSVQTIRDWTAKGKLKCTTTAGGTRLYDLNDLYTGTIKSNEQRVVFYCRVSSRNQQDDLERQAQKAKKLYPEAEIVKEIGSGLNWKRKSFRNLLKRAVQGELSEVKVFHRDRLCRFGFEIFEYLFELCGVQLSVYEDDIIKTREQEFAEDLLAIIHYFSCSLYGRRKYEVHETQDISTRETTGENSQIDAGLVTEDL